MPGEKSEKATSKRRHDERKKGHVFQSQDLASAAVLLSVFGALKYIGPQLFGGMMSGMVYSFQDSYVNITGYDGVKHFFFTTILKMAPYLLPILAMSILASVIVTMAQTRLLFTPGQLKPKFQRISPIQGLKKMFSLRSFVEMIKSILKITIIAVVIYNDIQPQITDAFKLFDTGLGPAVVWLGSVIIDVGFKASIAILIIGVADYIYQWWDFEKSIRMSKQEVKDEYKQIEGNPEIKGHIRSMQRRMARMRMMQAVPSADAVIKNPTHFAVAIKYDEKLGKAPFVVAKGRDNIALKIIAIAEKNGVYVTENRPLAQALYKATEIGSEIPVEFYKAIAEILAYIYRLRKAGRG